MNKPLLQHPIFSTERAPIIFANEPSLRDVASAFGLKLATTSEDIDPGDPIVVVRDAQRDEMRFAALGRRFPEVPIVVVSQEAFDPSPSATRYALQMLLRSNIAASMALQEEWEYLLRDARGAEPLHFRGSEQTDVTCRVHSDATPANVIPYPLPPGQPISAAALFEVSLEAPCEGQSPPAEIDGHIAFAGLIGARSPRFRPSAEQHALLHRLQQRCAHASTPGHLEVRGNVIREVRIDGEDATRDVEVLCGGLLLAEFAVGTNTEILDFVDWSVNCQLNEGAAGIHIGVGHGSTSYHVDFISPRAALAL